MSLPNGTVPMETGKCGICDGTHPPYGLNCGGCGHHFHIGGDLLTQTTPIFCPRCEGAVLPWEIAGGQEADAERSEREQQLIDIACGGDIEPEVIEAIRNIAKTRRSMDPNFWLNVTLRETWKFDHGSYDEWDKAARASGNDPTEFGPAPA